jgi:ribosomal protein S18 acetylase RimI-like enzyme
VAARIRPYERRDRDAVRAICFDTGHMGETIASTFADRACWADMLTAYYTDREPESCLVAELDGKVVAYLLGTLHADRVPAPELIAFRHGLTRLLPLRRGTAGFFWRSLYDTAHDVVSPPGPRIHPDLALYPGHAHFSVVAEARSLPIAPGLFRSFFKYAKGRGCPGLHGEVFVENERAMALNKALGYEVCGPAWPAVGIRSTSGQRLHVQLLVRKL